MKRPDSKLFQYLTPVKYKNGAVLSLHEHHETRDPRVSRLG